MKEVLVVEVMTIEEIIENTLENIRASGEEVDPVRLMARIIPDYNLEMYF